MIQSLGKLCLVCTLLGFWGGQSGFSRGVRSAEQLSPKTQKASSSWATAEAYNERLEEIAEDAASVKQAESSDYLIGADDLLQISVYGAPELGRTVRVSADGSISLPLIGDVRAKGLTAHELEGEIAGSLEKRYMNHPQVSVFVEEMQSHTVSVIGAVARPGTFQIRGPESLVQVLSMAQGLADDAGDRVIVMRHGGVADPLSPRSPDPQRVDTTTPQGKSAKPTMPASNLQAPNDSDARSVQVSLDDLLASRDPRHDVLVYPGDVVKIPLAGIVYVVGQVRKPGGFLLRINQSLSVLQALALAEGTTSTSAEKKARIIRTEEQSGKREEIPVNLKRILAGKSPDPKLQARDILFVPNSAGKTAFYRGAEAAVSITGGLIVYRSW